MDTQLSTISQAYFNNQLIIKLQIEQLRNDILDKSYGLLSDTFVKVAYPFYVVVNIKLSKNSDFTFYNYTPNYTTFSLLDIIAIFFPNIAKKYQYDYFSNNHYNSYYNDIICELTKREKDFFNLYCFKYGYKTMLKPFALKQFNFYTVVTKFCDIDAYYLLTDSMQENDSLAGVFAKYRLLELDQKWNDKNEQAM